MFFLKYVLYYFDLFRSSWNRRIYRQAVMHDITRGKIRIATKNETKQKRRHRNIKRGLLINPTLNKLV